MKVKRHSKGWTHQCAGSGCRYPGCENQPAGEPDWSKACQCGATPVVRGVGLCGPCTFGEAETAGGNW